MNECICWGVEESIKSSLVLLLWNILKFVKRVVQMCIYIMYMDTDKVCFSFFFHTCSYESSYDKFHDCYTSYTHWPDMYAPKNFLHYFW